MKKYFPVLMSLLLCACSPHPEQMAKPSYWLNSDLAGPDVDHNGIRDDVDAWIAAQPFTVPQKRAAEQLARSMQRSMLAEYKTREDARHDAVMEVNAINCMGNLYKKNYDEAVRITRSIVSATLNTRKRILKYDADTGMTSGMGFEMSENNTCE